jgi:hypothetical protein
VTEPPKQIIVELSEQLAAVVEPDTTQRIAASLQSLHDSLGVPSAPAEIEIRVDATADAGRFKVAIGGERTWPSTLDTLVEDPTSPRIADAIAAVLYEHRAALVPKDIARRVDPVGVYRPDLIERLARASVRACRRLSIDRSIPVDEEWVERQLWSAESLQLVLHVASEVDPSGWFGDPQTKVHVNDVAGMVQDALWGEDGFLIPVLRVQVDDSLRTNEFRIGINDVVFPPKRGLDPDRIWVPEAPDRRGPKRANPVSGAAGVVIARQSHLAGVSPVFDHLGIAILEVISAVRRNSGAFLCGDLVAAELDVLEKRAPVLVPIARETLGERRIAAVLRQLVSERVPVVDRLEILDAMVCYQGETTAPVERRILVHSEPGAWSVAPTGARANLDRGVIEAVRERLRARICRHHATAGNDLHAVVMDRKWENRLAHPDPLNPAEHRDLVVALDNALGSTRVVGPVLLTDKAVRRILRDEISSAFPDVGVLAFSEIDPRMTYRPISRVRWPDSA